MIINSNLEKEVCERHFMRYLDFCENELLKIPDEEGVCYRCKKNLEPLTHLEPEFYYQPCWGCVGKRKTERLLLKEGLIRSMREYYNKLAGDRYLQLFVVDDIYLNTTFPHTYSVFKKVISNLDPPSRNDIWFLDWEIGFPKLICLENLPGIKIVNLTEKCGPLELEKDVTRVGEFEIFVPEQSSFDPRHHSRYSLLNTSSDSRKSKRFRIGDKCVKFYNTESDNVKAIFKIKKNGEEIQARNLTHQEFVMIKLAIMRNKTFMRIIFDLVLEIAKHVGIVKDTIFLKNTVELDPTIALEKGECRTGLTLVWTALSDKIDNNLINLSII